MEPIILLMIGLITILMIGLKINFNVKSIILIKIRLTIKFNDRAYNIINHSGVNFIKKL